MRTRNLLTAFFCLIMLFPNTNVLGNTPKKEHAKEALKLTSLAYMSWSLSNATNLQPRDFIVDELSGRINGQYFLNPTDSKYFLINLTWKGNMPASADLKQDIAIFTWENGKLQRIQCKYLSGFDYTISYNNDAILLTSAKATSKGFKIIYEITFSEDKIAKIVKLLDYGKKKDINGIKEYSYSEDTYGVRMETYNFGKPNKPKYLSSNKSCYYKLLPENTIEIKDETEKVKIFKYNEKDNIISKKYEDHNGNIEEQFVYNDDKLFQKIKIITKENKLVEKQIDVLFSLPEQDQNIPLYNRMIGVYKFDANDELVYEKRDLKYREKKDGVWSDWIQMRY